MNLSQWLENNLPSEDMLWKEAFYGQIKLAKIIGGLLSRNYNEQINSVQVISTHQSKSIICPVYQIEVKTKQNDVVRFILRYNFYSWNISVDSTIPIEGEFLDCFSDENYGYCFCEGMEEYKYGPYKDNHKRFTVDILSDYDVYVFFRAIRKILNIR